MRTPLFLKIKIKKRAEIKIMIKGPFPDFNSRKKKKEQKIMIRRTLSRLQF